MKKVFLYALGILLAASCTACNIKGTVNSKAVKDPAYPKSISFEDYDSQINIRRENELDGSFEKALDDFSYASAVKLLSDKTKNISYSPTSLYMALSIAGIGANNGTQDEIFSVLGISGKSSDYLSEQNSRLFKLLYTDNEIGKLKIANSLWLQKSSAFQNAFINRAAESFYASLYNVDFSHKDSSKLMSNWISKNTNGVLSPQVTLDGKQIMSILNTVYYKDQWIEEFDKDKTKSDTFYLFNGNKVNCEFMNSTYTAHSFTRGEDFTASSLSLKNNCSMIFVLPNKGVRVENLLSSPEKAAAVFQEGDSITGKVIFQLPKFSYGSSLELKDALTSMGMKSAFKNDADFSGLIGRTDSAGNPVFISNIKQQTHVAIDEKGVEAAAFTEIAYSGSAPSEDEVAEMILNRPFIYAIKSNGRPIFIGVVNNPAEK
jgi:serine protease inhibitor